MLDETLSWNEQINALSNKVNKLKPERYQKAERICRPRDFTNCL